MMAKLNKLVEKYSPIALAMALAVAAYFFDWLATPPANFPLLLQAAISVAAIAVGFLVTAKGILISSHDREIIKYLKRSNQLLPLTSYFINATFWCMALCVISSCLLAIDKNVGPMLFRGSHIAWIGILGGSCAACVRVTNIYNAILKDISK